MWPSRWLCVSVRYWALISPRSFTQRFQTRSKCCSLFEFALEDPIDKMYSRAGSTVSSRFSTIEDSIGLSLFVIFRCSVQSTSVLQTQATQDSVTLNKKMSQLILDFQELVSDTRGGSESTADFAAVGRNVQQTTPDRILLFVFPQSEQSSR